MYEKGPSIRHKFEGNIFDGMRLRDLLEALEAAPRGCKVAFDNGELPGEFHSYRGYYDEACLAEGHEEITAAQLKKKLKKFIGSTQRGWKGGEFEMYPETPLWRADNGRTGYRIVHAHLRNGGVGTGKWNVLILCVDVNWN